MLLRLGNKVSGGGTERAQAHGKHWQGKYPGHSSFLSSAPRSAVIVRCCFPVIRQFSARRSTITVTKTDNNGGRRSCVAFARDCPKFWQ